MDRRALLALLAAAAVALPRTAEAQQAGKLKRIGFLRVGAPPKAFIEGFRQGLRELGLIEGQSITIEFGLAESTAQLPEVAAGLVRRKVDVILASGTPSVLPARDGAGTIPVVFVAALDPVATGVAKSLARPGGNVTGMTAMHADITGKRLQLLQELLPDLTHIAFLVRATSPAAAQYVEDAERAARFLKVTLQILAVRDPGELEGAFAAIRSAKALLVADDAVFTAERARIAELALKHRLATIYGFGDMVEAGGLMSYGPHYGDLYRRAATQVHKLLQGDKPADLPVEQPMRFEFVLNMKTAKALGLTIPPIILFRADEMIE
jgi:putative ABC transport system substrate-binding protein